jgi:hypothetical protein
MVGPNTVTCEVQTGEARYYVVGWYLLPSDTEGKNLDDVADAMTRMPEGCIPMVLGDLNVNLDVPRNEQEAKVAAVMDHHGMACASTHFTVRRRKQCKLRGRWTWKQRRLLPGGQPGTERIYRTKPDYFLMPARERRRIKRCRFTAPPHPLHRPQGARNAHLHGQEGSHGSVPPKAYDVSSGGER